MPAFKGAVLVDQYCNPLTDVTLESISAQLDDITEKVKKNLRVKNVSHPSLRSGQGKPVYQECLSTSAMLAQTNISYLRKIFCKMSVCPFENKNETYSLTEK